MRKNSVVFCHSSSECSKIFNVYRILTIVYGFQLQNEKTSSGDYVQSKVCFGNRFMHTWSCTCSKLLGLKNGQNIYTGKFCMLTLLKGLRLQINLNLYSILVWNVQTWSRIFSKLYITIRIFLGKWPCFKFEISLSRAFWMHQELLVAILQEAVHLRECSIMPERKMPMLV